MFILHGYINAIEQIRSQLALLGSDFICIDLMSETKTQFNF